MKEHLEHQTAADVDDLVFSIADVTERIYGLQDDWKNADDPEYAATLKRSFQRLLLKKYDLLRALKQALEAIE